MGCVNALLLVFKSNTKNTNRFRWAVCQLDTLGKCRNRLTLRRSLARLPPTLDETSERGQDKIVELLLRKGADVNTQGGYYGNALQAASAGGYDKTVELLLNLGADINMEGGKYGNALQAASEGGRHKTVKLLTSKGADV
jgi:ankyrin repeat protein